MIASPDIPDMTATGQQVLVEGPVPRPDDRKDWKMPASAVAAALAQRETTPLQPVVFVATSERRADEIAAALAVMVGDAEVLVLPPWDCLPYDRAAPSRESMGRRMAVLAALAETGDRRTFLITSPDAVAQRTPPRERIDARPVSYTHLTLPTKA